MFTSRALLWLAKVQIADCRNRFARLVALSADRGEGGITGRLMGRRTVDAAGPKGRRLKSCRFCSFPRKARSEGEADAEDKRIRG